MNNSLFKEVTRIKHFKINNYLKAAKKVKRIEINFIRSNLKLLLTKFS